MAKNWFNWYGKEDETQEIERLRSYHRALYGNAYYGGVKIVTDDFDSYDGGYQDRKDGLYDY